MSSEIEAIEIPTIEIVEVIEPQIEVIEVNLGQNGADGKDGTDGQSAYVYIAYADDSNGAGFTNTFHSSKNYIAIKTTISPIVTPIASDFAGLWKKYKGDEVAVEATENYLQVGDGNGGLIDGEIYQYFDGTFNPLQGVPAGDWAFSFRNPFSGYHQLGIGTEKSYIYLSDINLGFSAFANFSIIARSPDNNLFAGLFTSASNSNSYVNLDAKLVQSSVESFELWDYPNYNTLFFSIDATRAILNVGLRLSNIPTSSAGLSAGDVWNDGGTLKIV